MLSERVEALTGPDREIDRQIRDDLGLPNDYGADWGERGNELAAAFLYTSSLDAAMTLIPEHIDEWEVLRSQRDPRFGQYQARLELLPAKENKDETGPQSTMNGVSPAIALTAAALRSRGL